MDDKKVDRILRIYDFFLTEEGYNLLLNGIEGVDYNAKPMDTDLRLNYIDNPSKAKTTENFTNDMVKLIQSKDAEKHGMIW